MPSGTWPRPGRSCAKSGKMASGTAATGEASSCEYPRPGRCLGSREAGHARGCSTMGLERRGGGSYYDRKVRRGGRVVSEYLGGGPAALLMARIDAIEREEREATRDFWREERERLEAEEAEAVALFDRVEKLAPGSPGGG